jgi:hypothetical protein
MPTTTSLLTPTTHGLRVAASFNPRFERLLTPVRHDRRGEGGAGECVAIHAQRVHYLRKMAISETKAELLKAYPKLSQVDGSLRRLEGCQGCRTETFAVLARRCLD